MVFGSLSEEGSGVMPDLFAIAQVYLKELCISMTNLTNVLKKGFP
jgi:hypothetical protein